MAFNLLLVDDSKTVRAVMVKMLRIANVVTNEVFQAANGKEALEVIAQNWVDLIFADLNMPVMNGIELIRELKEDGLMESIPVVVVSSEGSTAELQELTELGVRAFVRKPFRSEQFCEVVNEILGASNE